MTQEESGKAPKDGKRRNGYNGHIQRKKENTKGY
jgi:hypothetical protein